jgi:hypothetical protein
MSYLVDSDWVAEYLKGRASAQELLDPLFPEGLAISLISSLPLPHLSTT